MPSSSLPEPPDDLAIDWDVDEGLEDVVDRTFLEDVLAEALRGKAPAEYLQVGVSVTTDEGIQDLNRRYRGVDAATDVLSFPMLTFDSPEHPVSVFPTPHGEPLSLGDIVISYPRAVEQAASYGHSLQRELAFLLVHSVMHLLGYDHEKTEDEAAMRRAEEEVLGRLGLTR